MMDNVRALVVQVNRHLGHQIPTLMHEAFSDRPSRENLANVAKLVNYPAKVEAEFMKAVALR
mgnify:CR=1 FL=1